MTEILFIRHGETDYNKKNLYYGYLNPGLNEIGTNQLKNTKKKLEEMNEKIDIVFSSDLKRCRQSLELLELDENIEKYFSEELRELNFGDIEGKSYDKIRKEFPYYIDEIKEKYQNKKILIVAHAGVIQTAISYYLFNNLDGYWKFKLDNGSITKMVVTDDGFIYFDYINHKPQ